MSPSEAERPQAVSSVAAPAGWRYGLMGLPLAFVALPLYVVLPNHYAREFGVPLAALGGVLLLTRLLDALIDPWLGRLSDRLFQRSLRAVLTLAAAGSVVMAVGMVALFFPGPRESSGLLVWCALWLALTYAAFSAVTVAHQSWGALLGGDALGQSRVVAWREGLGLLGVVMASVLPAWAGLPAMVGAFWLFLCLGWLAWCRAARPVVVPWPQDRATSDASAPTGSVWLPLRNPAFLRLLGLFMLNGIASAIPATLILFFVQDRLQLPPMAESVFLGTFFVCAALAMPLWLRGVARWGLARSWALGMVLSVLAFVGAATLGVGQATGFMLICALSGLALGADLALPGALLTGVIRQAGHLGQLQGAYWGWWNFVTKLNLALAAGLALPLLALLGYTPGAREPQALFALTAVYCLVPCALKLCAAALLYLTLIRGRPHTMDNPSKETSA